MGKIIINGRICEYTDETNVLEVIRNHGFNVPTLCYRKDLIKDFGACRMCLVEVEGKGLQAACNMPPKDGLVIKTHTEKLRKIRKTILELLIANHDRECTACEKSGNCELQKYALEENAKVLENIGAATIVLNDELTGEKLNSAIENIVLNNEKMVNMGKNALKVSVSNVEEKIYDEIKRLVR